MQLFKVKLLKGHKARPNQKCGNYLGYNTKTLALYSHAEALKKARGFGGIIEPYGKSYSVSLPDMIQLELNEMCPEVVNQLKGREQMIDAFGNPNMKVRFFFSDVFWNIYSEKKKQLTQEALVELKVLAHHASVANFILIVDEKQK